MAEAFSKERNESFFFNETKIIYLASLVYIVTSSMLYLIRPIESF